MPSTFLRVLNELSLLAYHEDPVIPIMQATLLKVTKLVLKVRVSLKQSDPRTLIFNNQHHSVFIPVRPQASWSVLFIKKKEQLTHPGL